MHRMPRALTLRSRPLTTPKSLRRNPPEIQYRSKSHFLRRSDHEPFRTHEVRFVRPSIFKHPRFLYRRIASIALYGATAYLVFSYASQYVSIEIEYADDAENTQSDNIAEGEAVEEDGEEPMFADEDSWFIPMTMAQKLPREYYRASDPEWQEFIKVAKDKKRQKGIHEELVRLLQGNLSGDPTVQRFAGKNPKLRKYWLDMSFPDGPPQKYVRAGIEIGDDFIAWSQQKVDPETQNTIGRVLWPEAAFESIWAVNNLIAGIQYRRIMQALGWEDKKPFSPEERYKAMKAMAEKHQAARDRKTVGSTQMNPHGSPDAALRGSSSSSVAPSTTDVTGDSSRMPWYFHVPIPGAWKTDGPIAMHVFRHTILKKWDPETREGPRGSLYLHGMVEVAGESGAILFDIISWYDPKTSQFMEIGAAIKNVKKRRQAPKGGP